MLCNFCFFRRVVLDPMVLGACQDSLDPRYPVCHIHNALQYTIFHNVSLKVCFWSLHKRYATFFLCSSGRPRVWWSGWTSWWKRTQSESFCRAMNGVQVCVCLYWCVKFECFLVIGWIWTQWTSWLSWRGWREGNTEKLGFHTCLLCIFLHFLFPISAEEAW